MDRLKEITAELEKLYRELDTAKSADRESIFSRASILTEEMAGLLKLRTSQPSTPRHE